MPLIILILAKFKLGGVASVISFRSMISEGTEHCGELVVSFVSTRLQPSRKD